MKIYKCKFTEDELCSDSYPMEVVDDVMLKFEGKYVAKTEGDSYGIGGDEEDGGVADPNTVHVVDIVDAGNLCETQYGKKDYMMHIKMYMKKLKAKLEAEDPERVAPFMKGAQSFVKKVSRCTDVFLL
jgi:Translationally controlled tumour protein